jgi:hypothetical protein
MKSVLNVANNYRDKNKTRRNKNKFKHVNEGKRKINSTNSNVITTTFLEMLNIVKLYHWNTVSYSQHKATDDLYSSLNNSIDEFIEVMIGKGDPKIHLITHRAKLVDLQSSEQLKDKIHEYRSFLIDLNIHFSKDEDGDLLSIRDDIMIQLNKFLYLLSLS